MGNSVDCLVNVPDPYNNEARIVGVRIFPGSEAYGKYGLSEPIDWFRKRFIESGILNHDGQKLLIEHILETDTGISESTKVILETLLGKNKNG